ncbi:MAG: DEAD/DEAH box helicase [Saprospiraceae bacterium]|nr:DEAD/DEAH box helicase [Saprospiraceae bacterium]
MEFSDMKIPKALLRALEDMELNQPSPIQEQVFSVVKSGRDVSGIAQTGTGKTLAYLLPVLSLHQYSTSRLPTVLILVPTRELVRQVEAEITRLTRYMSVRTYGIFGGVNTRPQADSIMEGLDILVGTPGRVADFVHTGVLNLKNIKRLIIDEFDEMLNQGFRAQLKVIFDKLPEKRQNLLFSATLNPEVEEMMDEYFERLHQVEAAPIGKPIDTIRQYKYFVPNFFSKLNLLKQLITAPEMTKVLVFVSNKKKAEIVYEMLQEDGFSGLTYMHANKNQNRRFDTLDEFESGNSRILIATDLLSRGLDIRDVSHVINFDLPEVEESYIHRIGRTGRFGKQGIAIAFVSEAQVEMMDKLEQLMGMKLEVLSLPEGYSASDRLLPEEESVVYMPDYLGNSNKKYVGSAFHEKAEKNKKVNVRFDYEAAMKKKYKKQYRPKNSR